MAALLTSLGEVVTAILGYVGDICATITAQPILLLTMGILLIGGAIGLIPILWRLCLLLSSLLSLPFSAMCALMPVNLIP